MNSLRFTLRFCADDEEERRAAEYLKSLKHGEQNRFLVGAVLSVLGGGTAASPESIRRHPGRAGNSTVFYGASFNGAKEYGFSRFG